jgi:dTDP-glucose 4,6-dehydratase
MTDSKNILVTGGCGFIGSTLVKRLVSESHDFSELNIIDKLGQTSGIDNIRNLLETNPRINLVIGDVRNFELVLEYVSRADVVIHLAAETHVTRSLADSEEFLSTDTIGTHNILRAILTSKSEKKFIHISSSEVYGTAMNHQMSETHPLSPLSPYAAAKCASDRLVSAFRASYDMPAIILRPFNNYGPNQHLEKLIPRFITAALSRAPLRIHGTGEAIRDWVHVDDTVGLITKLLTLSATSLNNIDTLNIGSNNPRSVLDVAISLCKMLDIEETSLEYCEDRPGQVTKHVCDNSKLRYIFPEYNFVPFEVGLQRTVNWYQENATWWKSRWSNRETTVRLPNGKTIIH